MVHKNIVKSVNPKSVLCLLRSITARVVNPTQIIAIISLVECPSILLNVATCNNKGDEPQHIKEVNWFAIKGFLVEPRQLVCLILRICLGIRSHSPFVGYQIEPCFD